MSAEPVHYLPLTATARTGEAIPVPAGADPREYRRFYAGVAIIPGPDGCHLWTRELFAGYGRFVTREHLPELLATRTVVTGAHRYAYATARGPLQCRAGDGHHHDQCTATLCRHVHLRHRCDETLCVNAAHLERGDAWDNARDRTTRGRNGWRRHGVRRHGADTRERHTRAKTLRAAVIAHLDTPHLLAAAVARVRADGDPTAGQLALFPPPRLRAVKTA